MKKLKIKSTPTYQLLALGEVLIDVIRDATGKSHHQVGGSPSNVVVNLHQLGANVAFIGSTGKDEDGQRIHTFYQRLGLSTQFLSTHREATTHVAINQTKDSPRAHFKRGADYHITMSDALEKAIKESAIFHFSFWPLTREPAQTTLLQCLKIAKEHQVLVGFDPNMHPSLMHPESLSIASLKTVMASVDIIKPSLDDAKRLFGEGLSDREYLEHFEAFDIPTIIMTRGKKGLWLSHHKDRVKIPSKALTVVDATGAGDAFLSGFYMSILNGTTVLEACHFGQRVSAFVLKKIGATMDLPPYDILKKRS